MRITFLSPAPDLSGGQRVVAIYAKCLSERSNSVEIVCSRIQQPTVFQMAKNLLRGRGLGRVGACMNSHYENYCVNFRIVDHSGPVTDRDMSDSDIVIATWWETAEWLER